MENVINILGTIGEIPDEGGNMIVPNTTFMKVVQQVEAINNPVSLNFIIESPGGYVEEGDEIHDYIESLKSKGVRVNTYAKNVCASIATKLFLAGEQRLLIGDPEFMIHNPFGASIEGDADELELYYKELRSVENNLINFYSEKTGTSKEAIKPLMKKETSLTNEQAIQLGFATGIYQVTQLKAVAYFKKYNLNKEQMSKEVLTKTEAQSMFKKMGDSIKAFLDPKIKNKLVQDATGIEIDFTGLEDEQTPVIGDIATIEGSAAEGEYLLPNGETYVFVAGALTEIRVAEGTEQDVVVEDPEALANFEKQFENLLEQLVSEKGQVLALKKENETIIESVDELKSTIKAMKKSMGSDFKHDPEKKKKKKDDQGSRKLYKD